MSKYVNGIDLTGRETCFIINVLCIYSDKFESIEYESLVYENSTASLGNQCS